MTTPVRLNRAHGCARNDTAAAAVAQEKFNQIIKELPQLNGVGCEIRVKNLGFSVQRPKGNADDPTVGEPNKTRCLK